MKIVAARVFSHINLERKLSDPLNREWAKSLLQDEVLHSTPKKVKTYDELVMDVAQILHFNRNITLYYRGQNKDYLEKGRTAIYPTIYRKKPGDNRLLLKKRFELLYKKMEELKVCLKNEPENISGKNLLNKYPEIGWSVLQHYEVCATPLLDLTHSLHVACSFAFDKNKGQTGVIYVLGMPWQNDAIGYSSYQELVNIRLLSVCPPQAQRPFFQEGYLAGPFPNYQLDNSQRRKQFDFARRLIAKFEIPIKDSFWGAGFNRIPQEKLYPKDDRIKKICDAIK